MSEQVNQATESTQRAEPIGLILSYHQRTKHHLHRYARGPGSLDWANQPDPFRTFADSLWSICPSSPTPS